MHNVVNLRSGHVWNMPDVCEVITVLVDREHFGLCCTVCAVQGEVDVGQTFFGLEILRRLEGVHLQPSSSIAAWTAMAHIQIFRLLVIVVNRNSYQSLG